MNDNNPDFWEWVKNKIKEREQQQPLYVEIQPPIPQGPPPEESSKKEDISNNLYEDINDDVVIDILKS